MITMSASLEGGPVLHFGVSSIWSCIDTCVLGADQVDYPMMVFAYAHEETVFLCHVLHTMARLGEIPRVVVMHNDLYVTYRTRQAPMTCLTRAGMYTGVGLPSLTAVQVCSVAELPHRAQTAEFFGAFQAMGKFVLVVTGPNKDPSDPLITVRLTEIGNKL